MKLIQFFNLTKFNNSNWSIHSSIYARIKFISLNNRTFARFKESIDFSRFSFFDQNHMNHFWIYFLRKFHYIFHTQNSLALLNQWMANRNLHNIFNSFSQFSFSFFAFEFICNSTIFSPLESYSLIFCRRFKQKLKFTINSSVRLNRFLVQSFVFYSTIKNVILKKI